MFAAKMIVLCLLATLVFLLIHDLWDWWDNAGR